MEADRRREITIEVYTGTDQIVGTMSTSEGRLSDTFNFELPHVVVLTEARSRTLEKPEASPTQEGIMHIDTMTIAFAVPRTPEPELEERRRTRMFEYVEKDRHNAVVKVPPFRFEGDLYLPKGDDIQRSLWELTPHFIPLSDATVTLSEHPEITWHREIVILHRRKAQIRVSHEGA